MQCGLLPFSFQNLLLRRKTSLLNPSSWPLHTHTRAHKLFHLAYEVHICFADPSAIVVHIVPPVTKGKGWMLVFIKHIQVISPLSCLREQGEKLLGLYLNWLRKRSVQSMPLVKGFKSSHRPTLKNSSLSFLWREGEAWSQALAFMETFQINYTYGFHILFRRKKPTKREKLRSLFCSINVNGNGVPTGRSASATSKTGVWCPLTTW